MALFDGVALMSTQYAFDGNGPFDAKMLVKSFDELTNETTWQNSNGDSLAYNGMIVAVWRERNENAHKNGIYFLHDGTAKRIPDVTKVENWHKLGELKDLEGLAEQITAMQKELEDIQADVEDLQDSATVIKEKRSDFPTEGTPGKLYVATEEAKTYVWANNDYLPVGDGTGDSTPDIQVICGGNATA